MTRWCDYTCEHASFPPSPDLLGACRTMAGVYCALLGRTVPKHTPCRAEKEGRLENGGKEHGAHQAG